MRNRVKVLGGGSWLQEPEQAVGEEKPVPIHSSACVQDSCVSRPAMSSSIHSSKDDKTQGLSGSHLVLGGRMRRLKLELAHTNAVTISLVFYTAWHY